MLISAPDLAYMKGAAVAQTGNEATQARDERPAAVVQGLLAALGPVTETPRTPCPHDHFLLGFSYQGGFFRS